MATTHSNSGNPKIDVAYRKKKNAEDMKYQLITFGITLFLTFLAFLAVGLDFTGWFIVPFIILLAVVQLLFQLYYFMHMAHKGHEVPSLFLYSGVVVAAITILTFTTIIWW
ncbi:cytochrome c oxidase subunit IVB [Cytobacillus sp. S13-E01]|uniref:cytochrome c oxidase subunit IVB n=1 Tax=Cytobacillus sp. S13-E01 TaxID=3031326 RepID=UPI0023D7B9C9|nr:cytochrome c oxidase subunit IVB [Cytobacillus sp. S13-E01]MDF0725321.1 cytochrome c oxidase subunit IVB [Cytobacillus sp. S13-E01]